MLFRLFIAVAIVAIVAATEGNFNINNVFKTATKQIWEHQAKGASRVKSLALQGSLPRVNSRATGFVRVEFANGNCETATDYMVISYPLGVCAPNNDREAEGAFVVGEVREGEGLVWFGYSDDKCRMSTGSSVVSNLPPPGCYEIAAGMAYSVSLDQVRLPHVVSYASKTFSKADCKGAHVDMYWPAGVCANDETTSAIYDCAGGIRHEFAGPGCTGEPTASDPMPPSSMGVCHNDPYGMGMYAMKSRCGGKIPTL